MSCRRLVLLSRAGLFVRNSYLSSRTGTGSRSAWSRSRGGINTLNHIEGLTVGGSPRFTDKVLGSKGGGVQAVSSPIVSVRRGMEEHKVVPDVIDVAPNGVVNVDYDKASVKLGNILTPTQVQKQPTVTWVADPNKLYLLCMTDPDAPSRKEPKFREWHHWLVGNIPGASVAKGEVLSEYIGAGPPQGTGLHRYVFLVYEQPAGKLMFTEKKLKNNSGDGRGKFSIKKLAEKYKLGQPVAGNLYQAEWDDYVPKLYKQLEGK